MPRRANNTVSRTTQAGAIQRPAARQRNAANRNGTEPRSRVSEACARCQDKKCKCNGVQPCARCIEDRVICSFEKSENGAKEYRISYVKYLERENKALKLGVERLQSETRYLDIQPENGSKFSIHKILSALGVLTQEGLHPDEPLPNPEPKAAPEKPKTNEQQQTDNTQPQPDPQLDLQAVPDPQFNDVQAASDLRFDDYLLATDAQFNQFLEPPADEYSFGPEQWQQFIQPQALPAGPISSEPNWEQLFNSFTDCSVQAQMPQTQPQQQFNTAFTHQGVQNAPFSGYPCDPLIPVTQVNGQFNGSPQDSGYYSDPNNPIGGAIQPGSGQFNYSLF